MAEPLARTGRTDAAQDTKTNNDKQSVLLPALSSQVSHNLKVLWEPGSCPARSPCTPARPAPGR